MAKDLAPSSPAELPHRRFPPFIPVPMNEPTSVSAVRAEAPQLRGHHQGPTWPSVRKACVLPQGACNLRKLAARVAAPV